MLLQIIKAKTTAGFVPNANTINDRSEPPIGSKVLLELFRKHGDQWVVEVRQNRPFFSTLEDLRAELIILPRQARDKH
jgi:hypothetical protein|eukprot:COSAG06_NODE_5458_length_3468_cov_1.829326_1_plen_78_part_00